MLPVQCDASQKVSRGLRAHETRFCHGKRDVMFRISMWIALERESDSYHLSSCPQVADPVPARQSLVRFYFFLRILTTEDTSNECAFKTLATSISKVVVVGRRQIIAPTVNGDGGVK